jgi:uncharacterized protein
MATTTKVSANAFIDHIKNRRTYYALGKDISVPAARVNEIVQAVVDHTPSALNSQSNRAVTLFGAEHDRLWDIVADTLRAKLGEERWQQSAAHIAGFKAGAGTVMFFEDKTVADGMAEKYPTYALQVPIWATQSNAMVQFAAWTALEAEGLGANLQHYNPLIDEKVAETWKLPSTWVLRAQMVFGERKGEASEKTFLPIEDKFKTFGA